MYCPECGSEVEENMQFCPQCGASIAEEAAPNDTSPEHPVTTPPTSIDLPGLFSRKMMTLAIGVGILVIFIGAVACNVADDSDGQKAGLVIYNVGGLLLGGVLFLGSFVNQELDRYIRVGMLIAGALVVGLILTPSMVADFSYGFP